MNYTNIKINHIALWVEDLEKIKNFYEKYFNAKSSKIYKNPQKKFKSYFLELNGETKIEIMTKDDIKKLPKGSFFGYTHLALSVGCKENVDSMINSLRDDGIEILSEPRTTGDGFYEAVILDPEKNIIEITE